MKFYIILAWMPICSTVPKREGSIAHRTAQRATPEFELSLMFHLDSLTRA